MGIGTRNDKGTFFRSTGKSLIPAESNAEELLGTLGPNAIVRVKITKPRRHKHHRFFFATVANYFDNWPIKHPFQPDNEEHLRAWATCKAGYRDILGERLHHTEGDVHRMADFIEKALQRSREKYSFVTIHNGSLVLLSPKSIAFDTLDQTAFAPIADRIFNVLEQESGIPIATMMAEAA